MAAFAPSADLVTADVPTFFDTDLGLALEADTAFAVIAVRAYTLGLASDTETAFAVTHAKAVALGLALEADTAFIVRPVRIIPIGLATEVDLAYPVTALKIPIPSPIPLQRWLVRTGHIDLGDSTVDDLKLTIDRGIGDNDSESRICVRANRDGKGFGPWVKKGLGKAGDRYNTILFGGFGQATVWQFEIMTTDDCKIELTDLEILYTRTGH